MTSRQREQSAQSVFHAGEVIAQDRAGVDPSLRQWAGQVIRPEMPDQHRQFFGQLPFALLGARDAQGRPWASMVSGQPGFIQSPDAAHLELNAAIAPGDALHGQVHPGSPLGLLGIELDTRRRNRMNGTVHTVTEELIAIRVDQSFGNCPQYITPREAEFVSSHPTSAHTETSAVLTAGMQAWIRSADTVFVATGKAGDASGAEGDGAVNDGMDVSHRGGAPGFVHVVDESHLVLPDYAGNQFFNTIGNLVLDPRIGLLFVDFEHGHLLQLTGRASIDWHGAETAHFAGAQRLVRIEVETAIQLRDALPLRWKSAGGAGRELRLVDKRAETDDVTSFEFVARDGGPLPSFLAGQHLPLSLNINGQIIQRSYSLSGPPESGRYRISVKRLASGLVSGWLHEHLNVGDFVLAGKPAGDFVLSASERPVVLLSAGIGITPMVSMLYALRTDHRSVYFIHGVRTPGQMALMDEVREFTDSSPRQTLTILASAQGPQDLAVSDVRPGRVTIDVLQSVLPDLNATFYLCGPAAFLADLTAQLHNAGVPEEQVVVESF